MDRARRKFLTTVAAGAVGGTVATLLTEPIKYLFRDSGSTGVADPLFFTNVGDTGYVPKLVDDVFYLLHGAVVVKAGKEHKRYPNGYHPDDYFANRAIFDFATCSGVKFREASDKPSPPSYSGTVICTGSPVSNALSRAVLQYEPIASDDGHDLGFRRVADPLFQLPCEFVLDSAVLSDSGVQSISRDRPNWSIRAPDEFLSADLRKDGMGYSSDLLLVTALPNILDVESFNNGERIILFGGTHGIGTRATQLLLRDPKVLQAFLRSTKSRSYWQVVVSVDQVGQMGERQHPTSNSQAVECFPIEFGQAQVERIKTWQVNNGIRKL